MNATGRQAASAWLIRRTAVVAFVLSLAMIGCSARGPAPAVAPRTPDAVDRLASDIRAAIAVPGLQRGVWGIVVQSLARDERLFELNGGTLLVPASAAKLVSAASAADAVGWRFAFETTLRSFGTIRDGTLHGDLIVVGSGDPSIGGRGGSDLAAWIDALRLLGVRRIDGRIVGDDNAGEEPRPGAMWAWDDLGYRTGALYGALNYGENTLAVTVNPGPMPGSATTLTVPPEALDRPLINRSITGAPGSQLLLWPEQRPAEPQLTIAGSLPVNAAPAIMAVAAGNPTIWFAQVLRQRLIASGVEVTGEAVDADDLLPSPNSAAAPVLYTHRSRPLGEIVHAVLKDSINIYGEALLRLGTGLDGARTNDAALDALRPRLERWGVSPEASQVVDGSGLSRRDVIAPDTLVAILRRMYDADLTSPWMSGLPIAGRDGTLQDRMRGTPAEANVRAKTGTMSNVRALAGYVWTADKEPIAFAIVVNNFEGTGGTATAAIDSIAARLAGFTREGK